jgi:hypothetical protein
MKLHIEMLQNGQAIGEMLREHGWRLDKAGASSYLAVHPDVVDQATARHRLHALGLLTSPALRINFGLQAHLRQLDRSTSAGR